MPAQGQFKSIDAWPLNDRKAWLRGTSQVSLLDVVGHAAKWRPAMVQKTARGYATWLNWLECGGLLANADTAAMHCIDERIDEYRAYLASSVQPVTVRSYLVGLERALSVIAPTFDAKFLKRKTLCYPKIGDTNKKRQRLKDPAELLQLAFDLMAKADAKSQPTTRDAILFRDGLMIGLLTLDTPRLCNLASIELGRQLRKETHGWVFEGQHTETKTHEHRGRAWPKMLVAPLDRYLSIYRPLLQTGKPPNNHLWLSQRFAQLTDNGIYYAIVGRTKAAFGKSINPHLFRDALATSLAIDDPARVALARHVLGNEFSTMQKYYNQARSIEASESLNTTFENLHKRAR
jgi:integrase/recombinase XerD